MTSGEERELARTLASMRQLLHADIDLMRRHQLFNDVDASDEVVASFLAALPADELVHALRACERTGVLAIWAHSVGRLFRQVVGENAWASDETLTMLAADYDETVSAPAYRALMQRSLDRQFVEPADQPPGHAG